MCYIVLVSCFLITSCTRQQKIEEHPNIIYILADDLGYGDISAFNTNGKINTPNIDQLADEGMKFSDAHTSSAVCTPTRYGILTGRYNWRSRLKSGVLTGKSKALIPNSRTTVASMLRDHGYHTSFIGKWHLGWDWSLKDSTEFGGAGWNENDFTNIDFSKPVTNTPNDLGFNYAFGHSGSLDMAPYVYVENGMPTSIPTYTTIDTGKYTWWRVGPTGQDFIHEEVTPNFFQKAMSQIQIQSKSKDPFFLYLALPSPHTPILPTAQWQGVSGINPYADFVIMIDDYVGQLMATVKASGIEENTLIIFASDNGCSPEADFELLAKYNHRPSSIYRGHKADIYEGGHRVPFIVKWPKVIANGSTSVETICTTDFLATCADIVNYKLKDDEGEDSFSLLPLFDQQGNDRFVREATVHHSINGSFAIRKGKWKLILCPGSGGWSFPRPIDKESMDSLPPVQLFNLELDPSETRNVQAAHGKVVKELITLLTRYINEGRSTHGLAQSNEAGNQRWHQIDFTLSQH